MPSADEQPVKPVATRTEVEVPEGPGLTAATVDAFITWAAGVPVGDVQVVRDAVAAAQGDDEVVARLLAELADLPVRDVGRHRVLLSTIGELRDPRAGEPLSRFIWHATIVAPEQGGDGCGFEASLGESLQARAVEMLSYLGTGEANEETLRVAAEHPSQGVRAAAIDAHLFNHDDDPDEATRIRQRVRDTDTPLIGMPRFTRETTRADFERAVEAYLERYPTQRPAQPDRPSVHGPSPRPRADEEPGDVQ
jgi:HEAT repeat protein